MAKGNPNRQKMINMMYLVLTALLALNVSKTILKAFELVNNGLEKTNASFTDKNNDSYARMQKLYDTQKAKAQGAYDKSNEIKKISQEMYDYIEKMKTELVTRGEGYEDPAEKADLRRQDDSEIGNIYLGGPPDVPTGENNGEKLRSKLDEYKAKMAQLVPDVKLTNLDTEKDKKFKEHGEMKSGSWTNYYFHEKPLISNLTMLIKFQNEIKNSESMLVKRLIESVGQDDFKFDNLVAIVSSAKPIVLVGQKYEADIVLAAYDSKQNNPVVVNGSSIQMKDGVAKYETTASGEGNKKVEGKISVTNPGTGETKDYKFSTEYQVFRGSAVISADKMNVVYIGLENPISISVPGFPPDKIIATCKGGSLKGTSGKYILTPEDNIAVKTCLINVAVKTDKGSTQMGAMEFRIKSVPKPVIKFGTIEGGKKPKVELSVQNSINAVLDGFVFDGVKYKVIEYTYYYVGKGGAAGFKEGNEKGNMVSSDLKGRIASGRAGDLININQIRVLGPDGKQRTINQGPTIILQ